ncbi:hypothetical protein DYB32_009159 [Aphanomyces invadans]|nr:hypothetical protein DYB32_009159 [Aphanomyces invadans]
MCQSIPIRHPGSAPKPVDANPRHVDSKAPWPANAAAAITDLDVDTMHSVLAFLALPDRVQFASTSKLLAEAGLSTNLKTYCGECACCHSNVRFLCNDAPQRTWTVPTWTAMLNRFGHALTELHLVGCADLAPSMFESAPSQRMLKNLRVLRIDMCTGLDARALQAIVETCSHLRKAHIMNMRLDDAGLAALLASNRATLREVDLSGCHLLDGTGFRALRSTQVEVMSLEGCHRINVFELDTMLKSCTTLRSLNLQYCHSADDT